MVVQVASISDELLPELEMSFIPCKLTDNVKVDLFGLSEKFLVFLANQGCIESGDNQDTQYMPMTRAVGFCKEVRDMYKVYRARGATSAHV